jgi:hypothetical protein
MASREVCCRPGINVPISDRASRGWATAGHFQSIGSVTLMIAKTVAKHHGIGPALPYILNEQIYFAHLGRGMTGRAEQF